MDEAERNRKHVELVRVLDRINGLCRMGDFASVVLVASPDTGAFRLFYPSWTILKHISENQAQLQFEKGTHAIENTLKMIDGFENGLGEIINQLHVVRSAILNHLNPPQTSPGAQVH